LVTFSVKRLQELFEKLKGKRIAVVGDLMLDRYYWGAITRISPEAPVPVVEVGSESTRLGGAANVANNIASLGGIPVLIGVVGNDSSGNELRTLIGKSGFPDNGVVVDSARPTTVKTRVIAHNQHVVRIDQEVKEEVNGTVQSKIVDSLRKSIGSLDGVILEDYNKGVLTKKLIPEIIALARANNTIITVDPKVNNFFEYKNVTVFKPNRKETEEALGRRVTDQASVAQACRQMVERLEAENVLLTLGEEGMSLFERTGTMTDPAQLDSAERIRRLQERRAASSGAPLTGSGSLDHGMRRRHDARHLDLLTVDHLPDAGGDLVLPVVALVDRVVEPLALRLALEAADPDVDGLVLLADEAAQDDHAHLDLERDDLLLHALDPLLLLSGTDMVLPELEEHAGLLGSSGLPGQHTANPGMGARDRPERV